MTYGQPELWAGANLSPQTNPTMAKGMAKTVWANLTSEAYFETAFMCGNGI